MRNAQLDMQVIGACAYLLHTQVAVVGYNTAHAVRRARVVSLTGETITIKVASSLCRPALAPPPPSAEPFDPANAPGDPGAPGDQPR